MRIFKIKDPMYGQDIRLATDCNQVELQDYLRRRFKINEEPVIGAGGKVFTLQNTEDNHVVYFVWFDKIGFYPSDWGLLAHELLHLTIAVLDDLGFPDASKDNDEPYCYYLQSLMETITRLYSKLGKDKQSGKKNKRGKRK